MAKYNIRNLDTTGDVMVKIYSLEQENLSKFSTDFTRLTEGNHAFGINLSRAQEVSLEITCDGAVDSVGTFAIEEDAYLEIDGVRVSTEALSVDEMRTLLLQHGVDLVTYTYVENVEIPA